MFGLGPRCKVFCTHLWCYCSRKKKNEEVGEEGIRREKDWFSPNSSLDSSFLGPNRCLLLLPLHLTNKFRLSYGFFRSAFSPPPPISMPIFRYFPIVCLPRPLPGDYLQLLLRVQYLRESHVCCRFVECIFVPD